MIFYYSAEGNSRHIAQTLGSLLNEAVVDVRQYSDNVPCNSAQIGFVFPVHCWGVPPVMQKFIKRLKTSGSAPFVWTVMTCGDDTGMADKMLAKCLRKSRLTLRAAFSVTMPNTYLLMRGFSLDSQDVVDNKLKKADDRVKEIAQSILRKENCVDMHRGGFPRFKTWVIYPFFFRRKIKSERWYVDKSKCTRCGLCIRNCPTANITPAADKTPDWGSSCVQCLACYHNCPVRTIDCLPYTRSYGQYTFPHPHKGDYER